MQTRTLAFVLATLVATPAAAQLTPEQARARTDHAPVVIAVPGGTWRGRLLDIDDRSVTIQPRGGPPTVLPLSGVLRIEAQRRDSLANGAIIGALIAFRQCARVCGQGLDGSGEAGAAIVLNAALGAAVGAAIDAGRTSKVLLYRGQAAGRQHKSQGLFLTIHF